MRNPIQLARPERRHGSILRAATTLFAAILLALPVGEASAAKAAVAFPTFSIKNLGVLRGGLDAEAFGLNTKGEIAGYGYTVFKHRGKTVATTHAFLYSGGKLHDLGTPPGTAASFGYGINSSGLMVAAGLAGGRERPYTVQLDKGRAIWTRLPGTTRNKTGVALALNDSGTVAGWLTGKGAAMWRTQVRPLRAIPIASTHASQATSIDAAGNVAGFDPTGAKQAAFWPASGSVSTLPGLGGRGSQARGVVATGVGEDIVVGSASTKHNVEQAASWSLHRASGRWTSSKPTALGVLSGFLYSRAYAANQSGWIVGYSFTHTAFHAFLWKSGKMKALNDLIPKRSGWDLTWATAINSRGQIAGWGTFHGAERPFLLTPN